jgi:hypothetical protein
MFVMNYAQVVRIVEENYTFCRYYGLPSSIAKQGTNSVYACHPRINFKET